MTRSLSATACALGMLLVVGCDRNEGKVPRMTDDSLSQSSRINENGGGPSQLQRDTYAKNARQEIDHLRSQIDALTVKARDASAELKEKLVSKIPEMKSDLQSIEKKWEDLNGASASAWKDLTQSLNLSIEKLRNAIKKTNS